MAESVPARTLWYQPELPDKPFLAQPRTMNPYLLIYGVSFMFQPLRIQRWIGPSVCLLGFLGLEGKKFYKDKKESTAVGAFRAQRRKQQVKLSKASCLLPLHTYSIYFFYHCLSRFLFVPSFHPFNTLNFQIFISDLLLGVSFILS